MKTKNLILCSLFAAIISVCAQISIPFPGGVPLTLQVLAICTTGLILGAKRGVISVFIYLVLGAVGLPVFAGFKGGMAILFGPTGGYLFSFPIMAYIIGLVGEKTNSIPKIFASMLAGLIAVYIVGTLYFSYLTGNDIYTSLMACVAPFLFTDIVKIILATVIGERIRNHKVVKQSLVVQ